MTFTYILGERECRKRKNLVERDIAMDEDRRRGSRDSAWYWWGDAYP